jgi:hypothetical protein
MLLEKPRPQASTYLRNIEKGKKEKKSLYQYVFLGVAPAERGYRRRL